jgi:hypothetical protein
LIVFKHPDPAGRNPADPDICRMYDIRHFRNSEPDSGTPLPNRFDVFSSYIVFMTAFARATSLASAFQKAVIVIQVAKFIFIISLHVRG